MNRMETTSTLREAVAKAIFEVTAPRPGRFLSNPKRPGVRTFTEYEWDELEGSGQREDALAQADAALTVVRMHLRLAGGRNGHHGSRPAFHAAADWIEASYSATGEGQS